MVNKDNIISFLNYNYTAFSKKQRVFRIFWLWILSVLCSIVQVPIALKCAVLLLGFVISSIFIVLTAKFSKNKVSRYLCDGLFCLYIAIMLNIASCGFLSLFININGILYLIFLLLLVLCVCVFSVLVFHNIKSDKYSINNSVKTLMIFPLLGSMCGFIFAKIFLQNIDKQNAVLILSIILLFLSLIISIGSLNLLKVFLLLYLKKSSASTRNSSRQVDIIKPSLPDRFRAVSYKVKKSEKNIVEK